MSPYLQTVKTASGARAVQIVHSSHRGSRNIEHIGSAHDDAELEILKAVARQRLAAGQGELNLGPGFGGQGPGGPLPITSSRMGHLLDALGRAYDVLGFARTTAGDEMFRQLVLARIIEPASRLDSLRVLEEAGEDAGVVRDAQAAPAAYARLHGGTSCPRHVPRTPGWGPPRWCCMTCPRCIGRPMPGDGFRESGFSRERRLEPQITIGLLTDAAGFPLMVRAFEGNKAVSKTMLPVITAFMAARQLPDVTVVADAGMISDASQKAIEDAGLSFILGTRIPEEPYAVAQRRREHPGQDLPDGQVFTQPWPAAGAQKAAGRQDKTICYQYRADRGRRTLRGIDEQVAKAEKAVAGLVPVKRNRFITLAEGENSVNRALEAKARALAGLKGYTTNLAACPDGTPVTAEFVISSCHDLRRIEKSFRMPEHDLQARPVYHHQRESIDAHLTIVFAALAVSRWIEQATRLVH